VTVATSHGVARRLQRISDDRGLFCVAAVDHRDSMVAEFRQHAGAEVVPAKTLTRFKADVIAALGDRPSAVMVEPEFSFPHLTDQGTVPRSVGVVCALEAQGYMADPSAGNQLMPGWTPRQLLDAGADCAKLLILYRPDDEQPARRQERLVRRVVDDCAAAQLPVLIEPVPYGLADEDDRRHTIVASARRLSALGPMILKLPYPGEEGCRELSEVDNPWALLSWGVTFDDFARQLEVAAEAGCSGFMVGRALWREAVAEAGRAEVLATTVVRRFDQLCRLMDNGRPWHKVVPPSTLDDWPWAR
jgi:tagatose-1,6-bisphosphate aldolase